MISTIITLAADHVDINLAYARRTGESHRILQTCQNLPSRALPNSLRLHQSHSPSSLYDPITIASGPLEFPTLIFPHHPSSSSLIDYSLPARGVESLPQDLHRRAAGNWKRACNRQDAPRDPCTCRSPRPEGNAQWVSIRRIAAAPTCRSALWEDIARTHRRPPPTKDLTLCSHSVCACGTTRDGRTPLGVQVALIIDASDISCPRSLRACANIKK